MDETLIKMLGRVSKEYPEIPAQYFRDLKDANSAFQSINYRQLYEKSLDAAAGFYDIGVKRADNIGLISDNRKEWQQCSMGLMALGAVDVPRGCDVTMNDLEIILSVTSCKIVVAENSAQVKKIIKIKEKLPNIETLIMFDPPDSETSEAIKEAGYKLFLFEEVQKRGSKFRIENKNVIEVEIEKGTNQDLVCIIFTSGTTGTPKGVELIQQNFLAQLDELQERILLNPGDIVMCILPIWHVFQRACEYVMLISAASLAYSRPIGSILLKDIAKLNPTLLPAVPRVFEAIYEGITRKMRQTGGIVYTLFRFFVKVAILHSRMSRLMFNKNTSFTRYYTFLWWLLFILPWVLMWPLKALGNLLVFRKIKAMLGNHFRSGVVGGGAFPSYIDEFFWAIGVKVIEGYGLTETAPVVAVRPMSCPVYGNVGSAIRNVKVRVVSQDDGYVLPRGEFGVIQVKGDTVMKGYYHNEALTNKVITVDGWFDTGDLGMLSIHDEIVIKGRKKDTIVLRGGENVEPAPIELKLSQSKYITQAVVVGQDQKYLAALILVNEAEVKAYAAENGLQYENYPALLKSEEIIKLFETEVNALVSPKTGFKIYERINRFTFLTKPFEVGVELSAKQEVMRYRMSEIYKEEIKSMFNSTK